MYLFISKCQYDNTGGSDSTAPLPSGLRLLKACTSLYRTAVQLVASLNVGMCSFGMTSLMKKQFSGSVGLGPLLTLRGHTKLLVLTMLGSATQVPKQTVPCRLTD